MNQTKTIPNRLVHEKSPYLLQHAYNPVDWFPWGDDAFSKAKAEDKPIFLSIGYSTCHWCHVMEQESFEDKEVADYLNENFVAIKVDKEERPDIDSIYMSVCQRITGSGGWPLTIIMLPNQKPFFAGTYFPKKAKYDKPGLMDILEVVIEKWKMDKNELLNASETITQAIKLEYEDVTYTGTASMDLVKRAVHSLGINFESKYGGFSRAPKFPTPHNLLFLLRTYYHEQNDKILLIIEKTLNSMYLGGIFDHIGYGFSRYSTDEKWLVPHFEKMLYDNALLIIAYLETYQITKNPHYKEIAEMTMEYVKRELTSEEGGFFSAQDADSEGVEGKYYVFEPKEVIEVLGEKDGKYFNEYYGITKEGNFEGKSIPNRLHISIEDFNKLDSLENERIITLRKKILEYRLQRTKLHKDDKILTSWNGLMMVAYAKAFGILRKEEYLQTAKKAEQCIREKLSKDDRLCVHYRDGESIGNGHLDDYAFYIWALLELYEVTLDIDYLERSIHYNKIMLEQFWDENEGGLFLYAKDSEELIHRPKELYDGAIPSGNSVATYCLLKLSAYTGDTNIIKKSDKQLDFITSRIGRYPSAYCFSMMALLLMLYPTKELICVTNNLIEIKEVEHFLTNHYLPNITVLVKTPDNKERLEKVAGYTKEYVRKDNKITFYLCENHACMAPFHEVEKLQEYLLGNSLK